MAVLKPIRTSSAMRRKMREFKGERSIVASTKNGRGINSTVQALADRGLVKIQPASTIAHRVKVAVLTEQGDLWMIGIEKDGGSL
jgi:hypothetical protein